jgi:hypothetical protein
VIQREHILQKHIKNFVRDAVDAEHEFFAFDRSPALRNPMVAFTRQKARGIRRATLDTLLEVSGFPSIWWECKWLPNRVEEDDDQDRMIKRLWELGKFASWGDSVLKYYAYLKICGVPFQRNALFLAQMHDASVLSEIAKAELKAGKVPKAAKPRASRATAGKIRRAHATGIWTP